MSTIFFYSNLLLTEPNQQLVFKRLNRIYFSIQKELKYICQTQIVKIFPPKLLKK
jgi:hypothetical protein